MTEHHKNHVKCYRCGTEFTITDPHQIKRAVCPHCHAKMDLDYTSYKNFRMSRYFVLVFVAALIGLGFHEIDANNNYIPVIIIASLVLLMSKHIDDICLWLVFKIVGLTYVDPDVNKQEALKRKIKQSNKCNG
ncbi:MAG: hypothetical protein LKE48_08860 [Solobacterium sp.]|nr:hypothetical protein [Solobacterium sp.]